MSETPFLGFPYPLPSDLVADGATNMREIDESVEDVMVIPSNTLTQSSPWNAYPVGTSMMQVTSANDFPNTGVCLTIRRQDGGQSHQYWSGGSLGKPVVAYRLGASNGWSHWIVLGSVGSIQEAMADSVTITTKADAYKNVKVTYPAGRFTNMPRVFCQYTGTAPHAIFYAPTSRSTTSFTMTVWADNSWAAVIQWTALRMNSDLTGTQTYTATAVSDEPDEYAVCQNPECRNYLIPINVGPMTETDDITGDPIEIDEVICGVCDTAITLLVDKPGPSPDPSTS